MLVSVSSADVVRIGFEACRCGGDGRNGVDVMVERHDQRCGWGWNSQRKIGAKHIDESDDTPGHPPRCNTWKLRQERDGCVKMKSLLNL